MSDVLETEVIDSIKPSIANDSPITSNSVGAQLAASRQSKNWTIPFVAEQLKLSQAQVTALESDNFAALPKMVIVRGFVRAYAKLLRIEADHLVAALPRDAESTQLETAMRPALSTPFVESRLSLHGNHDNNRRYMIGVVVLIVIIGVFLALQSTEFGRNIRNAFQQKESVAVTQPMNSSAVLDESVVAQPNQVLGTVPNSVAASVASVEVNAAVVSPVDAAAASVATAVVTETMDSSKPAASLAEPVVLPAANELFVLKFRQDSWVQVKTETGTILSSHLAKAGTEEAFSVKQVLYVKLGNAAGVDALLRGSPMTVTSERGNNVANLVVK